MVFFRNCCVWLILDAKQNGKTMSSTIQTNKSIHQSIHVSWLWPLTLLCGIVSIIVSTTFNVFNVHLFFSHVIIPICSNYSIVVKRIGTELDETNLINNEYKKETYKRMKHNKCKKKTKMVRWSLFNYTHSNEISIMKCSPNLQIFVVFTAGKFIHSPQYNRLLFFHSTL